MEKIQELVKEGKLSKNLMADKEFVDGAKEIFKSQNIDIDDKKLAQVMNELEIQLKKGNILEDKELEQVSGGLTRKGIGRGVIKATTTAIGTAIGFGMGVGTGAVAGGVAGSVAADWLGENMPLGAETSEQDRLNKNNTMSFVEGLGLGGGAGVGMTAGTPIGGYLGYKLGSWICKKTGLNEN